MVKKIFLNTFILSMIAIVLSSVVFLWAFYEKTEKQMKSTLATKAILVEEGLEEAGVEFLENVEVSHDIHVTWTDRDGNIIYDNIEYSDDIMNKTIYCDRKLDDGSVIRVANIYGTVQNLMFSMVRPIIVVLVVLALLMYIMANYTAKAIIAPINKIDLESGTMSDVKGYVEIKPLLSRIRRQNILIDTNIRELKRENAKRESFRRDFTANVSHELKTPLTTISGISEMLANGLIRQEDVPEFADSINKESVRLINLVNDIILISRLESDEIVIQKEEINLCDVVKQVVVRLKHIAAKKNIHITYNMPEEVKFVGVFSMLEELVFNLCDNAIKYNYDNGLINVILEEEEDKVRIIVEDSGIGIPEEERKAVFERFYRVDKSRSKEVGGTGLGLSIVKHIAIYHGGKVKAENRQGGGTRMIATLKR